jgi:predicted lactoylglutathione lyase
MAQMIFVNLPVTDLDRSKRFFEALGFSINPQFSDETAACVVISDTIFAMILTHAKFREFTSKEIADSSATTEVLIALSRDSREAVDQIMEAAMKNGGREARPTEDMGFMYHRAFEDPDRHIWEVMWMDMSQVPPAA